VAKNTLTDKEIAKLPELNRISYLAKRAGMSYGKYEAAVANGLIKEWKPPKEAVQKPAEGIGICKLCGGEFEQTTRKDGSFGRAQYCRDCRAARWRDAAEQKREISLRIVCKVCGKEADRLRESDNRLMRREICAECLEKERSKRKARLRRR